MDTRVQTYGHTCTDIDTQMQIHTDMHVCTHTQTHTCTHRCACGKSEEIITSYPLLSQNWPTSLL